MPFGLSYSLSVVTTQILKTFEREADPNPKLFQKDESLAFATLIKEHCSINLDMFQGIHGLPTIPYLADHPLPSSHSNW